VPVHGACGFELVRVFTSVGAGQWGFRFPVNWVGELGPRGGVEKFKIKVRLDQISSIIRARSAQFSLGKLGLRP